jgi:hypothetical protein
LIRHVLIPRNLYDQLSWPAGPASVFDHAAFDDEWLLREGLLTHRTNARPHHRQLWPAERNEHFTNVKPETPSGRKKETKQKGSKKVERETSWKNIKKLRRTILDRIIKDEMTIVQEENLRK